MKRKFLILLILLMVFVSGCKSTHKSEEILLQKVNISEIKNTEFLNSMEEVSLSKGIYLLEYNSEEYILFSKINIKDENTSCNIDGTDLEINIETEKSNDSNLYKISNQYDIYYDLIKLVENGKEASFSEIILSDWEIRNCMYY